MQARHGRSTVALCLAALLHGSALAIMFATEVDLVARATFLLVWALLNCFWLGVLRRPIPAAVVSLTLVLALIRLSQLKHDKLWTTLDFVDLMIVDQDTSAFLITALPSLGVSIAAAVIITTALVTLAWHIDPFRIRLLTGALGGSFCMAAIVTLALAFPTDLSEDFISQNHVSKFARTGVEATYELNLHGYLDAGAPAAERLNAVSSGLCRPAKKLPHILLMHDELSFDITTAPGIRVPPNYRNYFQSFDGTARKLVVEGASGPSWFTEYNVLTGLSVRSYGRFATSVTRIAAGHVTRGLPHALRRCGYKTFSLYPFYGAFLGSRNFQTTTGIENYRDMLALGTNGFEPDSFYFDQALSIISRERGIGPLFLYVYNVANHFPWDTRLRPERTPTWRELGNAADIDEYVRRQGMTAQDYRALLERLRREFPNESFPDRAVWRSSAGVWAEHC